MRLAPAPGAQEERKIDFRLVEEGVAAAKPLTERGKPAKRQRQKYCLEAKRQAMASPAVFVPAYFFV